MTERLHFHFSLSCIGGRNGNPLQCSCLENARGGGAWWAAIYGVSQNRTQLKRLSSSGRNKENVSGKEKIHCIVMSEFNMSDVLAWRIPGTGEPGGLPSMGSHRIRHDSSDLAVMPPSQRKRRSLQISLKATLPTCSLTTPRHSNSPR